MQILLTISTFPSLRTTGISEGSGSPNSLPFFIGVVSFILVVMVVGGGSILTWMHQSRILVA